MPTLADAAELFRPDVRARGDAYFRAGRVEVVRATPERVEARVLGPGHAPHLAIVSRGRAGAVALDCDCRAGDEPDDHCEHLWATLRALEATGHPLLDAGESGTSEAGDAPHAGLRRDGAPHPNGAAAVEWRRALDGVDAARVSLTSPEPEPAVFPPGRRLAYVVDVPASLEEGEGVLVELATQAALGDAWEPPERFAYSTAEWLAVPDPADREIAQMLVGARPKSRARAASGPGDEAPPRDFRLLGAAVAVTLPRLCATGRAFARLDAGGEARPLAWDDAGAWTLRATLVPHEPPADAAADAPTRMRLSALLARDVLRLPLRVAALMVPGLVLGGGPDGPADGVAWAAPLADGGAIELALRLRDGPAVVVEPGEAAALAGALATRFPDLPPLELPDWLGVTTERGEPRAVLALRQVHGSGWGPAAIDAVLAFDYGGVIAAPGQRGAVLVPEGGARLIERDRDAERALRERLELAGARAERDALDGVPAYRVPAARADRVAGALAGEGWAVTLDGRAVRRAGAVSLSVRSGIDWFDLEAVVDFGGAAVPFPRLLDALRRGERSVALPDGALGVLPDEWLARHAALGALGASAGDALRFGRAQAALLDALLEGQEVRADATFEAARAGLRHFAGAEPADPPPGFGATLRPYQREGLGWLHALGTLGLGGILADDMGLGKTVQALALLEARRQADAGPSIVVVPRSLVFNWVREAARFAPALRVLVYHGPRRRALLPAVPEHDVVLTTYQTLRQDVADLREVAFDYAVLDEAQAVKNADTAIAKAVRLLRARHRLAMSGTPIENRLEELWSLFEFLNPGALGGASAFARLAAGTDERHEAGRALVARAVRPFVLRRTKARVATDLPPRVEQTVWVELSAPERRLYDELREYYRASLLERVARGGVGPARMHVLEALLRLRQAACHPGLVDPSRAGEPSAKLDVLLERLEEATAEGHRTLVFSQFTSLLAIVRSRLDAAGTAYEYLDGATRDREARVDRFQRPDGPPVFLVSLKAGGVGLNLTAADHVVLLDPWWNPAAEAQAVDRAHRIGQTRPVLAARLVARDTVEEKVVALQREKRALADAIVGADDASLARLTREDLELLLG